MSTKVKNPNQKSSGFIWAVLIIVVLAAVLIGYLVVNGNKSKEDIATDRVNEAVAFETTYEDNGIILKAANAKADAKSVELYEDFSCPHCADLAVQTDADMKTALENGDITVTIRSLNFLDREAIGNSTMAGTAAYAVAKNESPEVYWNFRKLLMEDQEKIYTSNWEDADFANAAKSVGASEETVKTITNGTLTEEYIELATKNSDKLEKETGSVSSPRVIIDGTEIKGADIFDWVNQATKA